MRRLYPNHDREDGLETVLEVPVPDDVYGSAAKGGSFGSWVNLRSCLSSAGDDSPDRDDGSGDTRFMLGVAGAPLIPFPASSDHRCLRRSIKDHPIEASMAKYIVRQYIAAAGGEKAVTAVESMYAMGKVKLRAWEFPPAGKKSRRGRDGEVGGFVLWQKKPDLWFLELVVPGGKISAGSDGQVAWRQTPWHHAHASHAPPRPLRRLLQGLDPGSTASIFHESVCIGEKAVDGEDCFVLKLEAPPSALQARSGDGVEAVKHTVWGYFSQRTGLLAYLEDTLVQRLRSHPNRHTVFWETSVGSSIRDYRTVDGVSVAHGGRTAVLLLRVGEDGAGGEARTRMEEVWTIEEVGFNVRGLSMDCFLSPADLQKDNGECHGYGSGGAAGSGAAGPVKARAAGSCRVGGSRVAAVDHGD